MVAVEGEETWTPVGWAARGEGTAGVYGRRVGVSESRLKELEGRIIANLRLSGTMASCGTSSETSLSSAMPMLLSSVHVDPRVLSVDSREDFLGDGLFFGEDDAGGVMTPNKSRWNRSFGNVGRVLSPSNGDTSCCGRKLMYSCSSESNTVYL